jgi:hypothetical protein
MALSNDQLSDFRADIGDVNNAFSDAEIQRLYVRAGENYDEALVLGIDQLVSNAVKFSDYTSGESSDKRSQVFDHLMTLRTLFKSRASLAKPQVRIAGMKVSKYPKSDPYA